MPLQPPPCRWVFPPVHSAAADGFLATGADLEPGTLLAAYASGIFPMPVGRRGRVGWWSPDPRGLIPLDGLRVNRSLRSACRRYDIRVDTAFGEVIRRCADPRRPGGWISRDIVRAYDRLHTMGWAHSVEAWTGDGRLAGGLYGVTLGGLFAGESMFHRERDASKVALVGLVDLLRADNPGGRLLDVQWCTDHLRSLGAVEIPRAEYVARLGVAVRTALPEAFGRGPGVPPPPGAPPLAQLPRRTR
ncbi:MAG: leucyl/phenylalanyl-tRNA--protein transferase [Actinomycetes bacterium]